MQRILQENFKSIPTDDSVIVAVSGGSDSMALLLLANIWAKKNDVHLQAITIDHGLRPEAAAEAAYVASVCIGLEIDHVTLAWEGAKPALGLQNAARQSRYHLLDQFAQEIGCHSILTGHTLDDQIETVYMRNQRHSPTSDGIGISGMAEKTWLYGGTKIFRPLLDARRSQLRQILSDFGQSWIEDPSNIDESYERVRVRQILSEQPELAEKYSDLAKVGGALRHLIARDCAQYLEEHLSVHSGPVFELAYSADKDTSFQTHPIFLQAVQKIVGLAGGQEYLTSLKRLAPLVSDIFEGSKTKVTIGGSVVELLSNKTETKLRFFREVRNQRALVLEPGEVAIWDGRMHVNNVTANTVFIETAKKKIVQEIEELKGKSFEVMPRQALWSTPVIHVQVAKAQSEDRLSVCLPLVDASNLPRGLEVRLAAPAIEHFCPAFDAPLRDWVMSLDRFSAASIFPKS